MTYACLVPRRAQKAFGRLAPPLLLALLAAAPLAAIEEAEAPEPATPPAPAEAPEPARAPREPRSPVPPNAEEAAADTEEDDALSAEPRDATAGETQSAAPAETDRDGEPAAESPAQLVRNPGFEEADPAEPRRPWHWQLPDGVGVAWTSAPEEPGGSHRGRAIRMNTAVSEVEMVKRWRELGLDEWVFPDAAKNAIGATYGLSYYSAPFPIQPGRPYRLSFDYRGPSGGAKVWVRGYGTVRGREVRRYETWAAGYTKTPKKWTRIRQIFHPTRVTPGVEYMKVMLYAFWPAGEYWFDNVRIEPATDEAYAAQREADRKAIQEHRARQRGKPKVE